MIIVNMSNLKRKKKNIMKIKNKINNFFKMSKANKNRIFKNKMIKNKLKNKFSSKIQ